MNYTTNVPLSTASVHDDGAVYTESGMRIEPAEVRAREVAEQAGRWLAFATERTRMKSHTLTAKALQATAFSVQRGASSFAVPSKLVGTSKYQRALWALVSDPAEPWARLETEPSGGGLTAGFDGATLGLVQTKHLGWLRPLLAFGLTVHINRVTGHTYDGYSLGANVVFGHVGTALNGLLAALGQSGDSSGDGAPSGPVLAAGTAPEPEVSGGDGAAQGAAPVVSPATDAPAPLRLVVRPEHEALDSADPLDVVLYRSPGGTPHASCAHVVRHSPTGVGWGAGSGAAARADLALSVLTHVAGAETAETHYSAFADEVVARVMPHGGVLMACRVRAWIDRQSDRPTTAA